MTNIIKQAAHVATTIATKEKELSDHRAELDVEADKFTLIGILAVEASTQNFRAGTKKAGQFLETVCFDVLGQKNKTGKGKKLAENAPKLARHDDFEDIVRRFEGDDNMNLTAGEFRNEINQRCEELKINSFNQLIAHLNPKDDLNDVEQIIALAKKIVAKQGHLVETTEVKSGENKGKLLWTSFEARDAVFSLLQDAVDTAHDQNANSTPVKLVA